MQLVQVNRYSPATGWTKRVERYLYFDRFRGFDYLSAGLEPSDSAARVIGLGRAVLPALLR